MKMRKARKGFKMVQVIVKNVRQFEFEGRKWTATDWEYKTIFTSKGESK